MRVLTLRKNSSEFEEISEGECMTATESRPLRKVLIANRGEIAVRIARACKDAGIASAGAYAVPDRAAPHARHVAEAAALGRTRAAATYLAPAKTPDAPR